MKHQLALVTGATSGIGREIAHLLANRGISLILSGTNHERLMTVAKELESKVPVKIIATDLRVKAERARLIQLIREQVPDLVINNAGFGLYGDVLSYPTQDQVDILEVDGYAVLEISIEAAHSLVAKGKAGVILNVASAAAFQLIPGMAVYTATKSFVIQFSEAFDMEVEPQGVRILVACPGMVDTQFSKRAGGVRQSNVGVMPPREVAEAIWDQIERKTPCKVINWKYRLVTVLSKLLPKRWLAKHLQAQLTKRLSR